MNAQTCRTSLQKLRRRTYLIKGHGSWRTAASHPQTNRRPTPVDGYQHYYRLIEDSTASCFLAP